MSTTKSVYAGRNLAYVRELLGMPPKYASAKDAAQAVPAGQLDMDDKPEPGSVVYYDSRRTVHGNIAIAVGHDMVLTCSPEGIPRLWWHDDETLGTYLGWAWTLGDVPIPGTTEIPS